MCVFFFYIFPGKWWNGMGQLPQQHQKKKTTERWWNRYYDYNEWWGIDRVIKSMSIFLLNLYLHVLIAFWMILGWLAAINFIRLENYSHFILNTSCINTEHVKCRIESGEGGEWYYNTWWQIAVNFLAEICSRNLEILRQITFILLLLTILMHYKPVQ